MKIPDQVFETRCRYCFHGRPEAGNQDIPESWLYQQYHRSAVCGLARGKGKPMRLIDADSLLKYLFVTESRTGGSVYAQAYEKGWDDALKAVMAYEPTAADAAEVVRCKDCRWWSDKNGGFCDILGLNINDEEFFCAWGEQRRKADE